MGTRSMRRWFVMAAMILAIGEGFPAPAQAEGQDDGGPPPHFITLGTGACNENRNGAKCNGVISKTVCLEEGDTLYVTFRVANSTNVLLVYPGGKTIDSFGGGVGTMSDGAPFSGEKRIPRAPIGNYILKATGADEQTTSFTIQVTRCKDRQDDN